MGDAHSAPAPVTAIQARLTGTPITVFVGYENGPQSATFFPSPREGSPNVNFIGNEDGQYDAGALRFADPTPHAPVTVESVRLSTGIGRGRRLLLGGLAAALPWSWFLVRDSRSLMDVVATGLPVVVGGLGAAVMAAALLWRRVDFAGVALSLTAAGGVAIVGPWLPQPGGPPTASFSVVAANAFHNNPQLRRAATDLRAQDADVVVVVEDANNVYESLRGVYPVAQLGPQAAHAVLSRFPVRRLSNPTKEIDDTRLTRWEVMAPSGPVIIYAVHLQRPRVRLASFIRSALLRQRQDVAALLAAVRAEAGPTMVVGDFNLSDRAWGYRQLAAQMKDGMRTRRAGPTYVRPRYRPFLLRIDHIFVPRSWCSAGSGRFEIGGSDHLGVTARVGPCR